MVIMDSSISYLLIFCFCFQSVLAFNETIKHFEYQDILRHVAQIGHFDYQQDVLSNLQRVKVVKNIFYDPEPNLQNSKAFTLWKLLHDSTLKWKSTNNSTWNLSARCVEGINETFQGLKRGSSWAIRMIDATGKPGSNIEGGNIVWIGSLSECLDVRAEDNNTKKYLFKGQYSIVVFVPPGPVRQIFPGLGPILGITLGLCSPSTCTPNDIQTLLNLAVQPLSVLTNHTIRAGVLSTHPGSRPPLSTSAIAVITLLSVIGFSIVLGTLYDVCLHRPALEKAKTAVVVIEPPKVDHPIGDEDRPINVQDYTPLLREREEERQAITQPNQKSVPMRILLALSAYSNGQKILNTNRTPGTLDCVHGIRFLSMTWVILGHTLVFVINVINNLIDLAEWTQRWTFQAIMNATFSVDSFFVLSGTLVSYLLLKELRNKNGPFRINWALFYFHRFWRLTPVYMLILGANTALFIYTGDGPAWPFAKGSDPACKQYWWTNLLYINNFFGMKKQCMGWSWYLANDMQFFVIAPFIIVGFYFKWFIGAALSLLLILVDFVSTAMIVLYKNNANAFTDIYIKPWCRIGPYAVGIVTGYLLHVSERNPRRLHKGVVILGWALAAASNLAVLYGLYEYNSGKATEPRSVNAFYQACSRTAWGLALAWVIFACCRGYGGYVNTILSWPGIIPLSRLTYTAYLVHPIVLSYYNYSLQQSIVFNNIVYIWMFLGGLAVSYGVAFIASLAFEAPMMALEKVVFPRN